MAVPARLMAIELTITPAFDVTPEKASMASAVASVSRARVLRRPRVGRSMRYAPSWR
jgi:hypothetical protein